MTQWTWSIVKCLLWNPNWCSGIIYPKKNFGKVKKRERIKTAPVKIVTVKVQVSWIENCITSEKLFRIFDKKLREG